jgi:hypothetical protein
MKIKEIIMEVPMNPTSYADTMSSTDSEGIKVGFEFEVCIPEKSIKQFTIPWYETLTPNWLDEGNVMECFSLKQDIEYKGQKFDDIYPLYAEWRDINRTKKAKTEINKLPPQTKEQIFATWDKIKDIYNSETGFYRAIYDGKFKQFIPIEIRSKIIMSGGYFSTFMLELFGSKKFDDLIQHPALKIDVEALQEEYNWVDDDDNYAKTSTAVKNQLKKEVSDVIVYERYHQSKKNTTSWYIEPDGSIEPNGNDGAVEIVTPPLLVNDAFAALKIFTKLAKEMQFYTSANNKTGLHINVSIPKKLDVLKLAAFIGETHLLQQWGRENNHYVQSIIKTLQSNDKVQSLVNQPEKPQKKVDDQVNKYEQLLKIAQYYSKNNHNASVNFNGKYVSFRHVGGDYIKDPQVVTDIIGRFIRAMVIASDPMAYRKEYLTKLVKIFAAEKEVTASNISQITQYKNAPIPVTIFATYTQGCNTANFYDIRELRYDQLTLIPKDTQVSIDILNSNRQKFKDINPKGTHAIKPFKLFIKFDPKVKVEKPALIEGNILSFRPPILANYLVKQQTFLTPGSPMHTQMFKILFNARLGK